MKASEFDIRARYALVCSGMLSRRWKEGFEKVFVEMIITYSFADGVRQLK